MEFEAGFLGEGADGVKLRMLGEWKRSKSRPADRRQQKAAEIQHFAKRYARTAKRGALDPNDRDYSRDIERRIKQMRPEKLDELLRGED